MSNRRHWYLLNNEKMLKGLFMSDALTQLNNIRTLRSQTREMSLDVLEDVLEKFKIILIERREEETLRHCK